MLRYSYTHLHSGAGYIDSINQLQVGHLISRLHRTSAASAHITRLTRTLSGFRAQVQRTYAPIGDISIITPRAGVAGTQPI